MSIAWMDPLARLDARGFDRVLRFLLSTIYALGLLVILLAAWKWQSLLLYIPVVCLGALAVVHLRDELYRLCAVLAGFVFVAGYEAGFQAVEAVYGLVYLSYLGHWFISRFFFYRDWITQTWVDRALLLFLVFVTASFGLTFLFEGDLAGEIRS